MENEKRLIEGIDKLIQHYQNEADELKLAVERASGSDATVSMYKAMHSLWRTCCNFVADLDELAANCEIAEFVESCEECGFCNNKDIKEK